MTSRDPWDREGVEPAVREAVERAASDAGLTVGEWLRSRAAGDAGGGTDLPSDMADILRRIESIDRRSTLAISGIDQTVLGLIRRLDLSEEELVAHVEGQDGRLESVESRLGSIADDLEAAQKRYTQSALKERLRPIEVALSDLATHLETSEKRNSSSIAAIEADLGSVSSRLGTVEGDQESALGTLRSGLDTLTERVDLVDRKRTALLRSLEVTVTDLAARIDDADADTARTAQKLETTVSEISDSVDAQRQHTQDALEGLEQGLQRLSEEVQETRTLAASAVKVEDLKSFEGELTDRLRSEIDQAIDRTVQEFDARIEASSKRQFDAIEEIDTRTGEMLARAERGLEDSRDGFLTRLEALEAAPAEPQSFAAPVATEPSPEFEARIAAIETETKRSLDAIETALSEIRAREARDADELREALTQNTTRMAGFKAQLDDLAERVDRQDAEKPATADEPEDAEEGPVGPHAETTKRLEAAAEEISRAQTLATSSGPALFGIPGGAQARDTGEAEEETDQELEEFLSELEDARARNAEDEEILIEVDEAGTIAGAHVEGPPSESLEDAEFEDLDEDEEDEGDVPAVPFPEPERGTAEQLIEEAEAAAEETLEDLDTLTDDLPPPPPEAPAEPSDEEADRQSEDFLQAARRAAMAGAGATAVDSEPDAAPQASEPEDRARFPYKFLAVVVFAIVCLILLRVFNPFGRDDDGAPGPDTETPAVEEPATPGEQTPPAASETPAAPAVPDGATPANPTAGENDANTPQGDPSELDDFPVNRTLSPPELPKDPLADTPGIDTTPGVQPADEGAAPTNPSPAVASASPPLSLPAPQPTAPASPAAAPAAAPQQPAPAEGNLAGAPQETAALTPGPESAPATPRVPQTRQALAEAGDARSQYLVAVDSLDATNGTPDPAEAAKWLSRAAAQGFTPAEYRLGRLYETGRGVGRNPTRASELYRKAAEDGNRKAMHNLAYLYASGRGVQQDYREAAKWFRQAAELGLTDSQYNLGVLYEDGVGVTVDNAEAYKWFSIAAKNGDAQAALKRDDLGRKLTPEQVKDLQPAINAWAPKPLDAEANGSFETGSAAPPSDVARAQSLLNQIGFAAGRPDGVMGPRTAAAIRAFEASAGLRETGRVSRDLLNALERAAQARQG